MSTLTTAMADPATTGRRVLEALDAGRRKAIERRQREALQVSETIVALAHADMQAGRPRRGMAGRIARKLGGLRSESQVRKILSSLFSAREFVSDTADQSTTNTEN